MLPFPGDATILLLTLDYLLAPASMEELKRGTGGRAAHGIFAETSLPGCCSPAFDSAPVACGAGVSGIIGEARASLGVT